MGINLFRCWHDYEAGRTAEADRAFLQYELTGVSSAAAVVSAIKPFKALYIDMKQDEALVYLKEEEVKSRCTALAGPL